MTAPNREQFANNAFTTLDGAIDASQTTLDVVDGSVFPSSGNFRIIISTEILLCTARSGNTLTVVRGVEGSTGASHSDASNVVHVLTAGGLTRWAQDNHSLWGYSSAPPVGKLVDTDGVTPLTASSFTWGNQGTATATDQNGTILLRAPFASGENCRVLYRTAPSPPYVLTAAIQPFAMRQGIPNIGIGFRKNSDTKMSVIAINADNDKQWGISVYNWNSPTSFSSNVLARTTLLFLGTYLWMRVEDDNTNLLFSVSSDGIEWVQIASVGRTSFMSGGPDEVCLYLNNNGSTLWEAWVRLAHWSYQ